MSKRTRNILLVVGVIFALLLVGLRVMGQINASSGGLGAFFELLGYEGPKSYAIIFIDQSNPPSLLVAHADQGEIKLVSVTSADKLLVGLPALGFATTADALIGRVSSKDEAIDAVAFVTSEAAGEVVDAFGGAYLGKEEITSKNISGIISGLAASQAAIDTFNSSVTFHKENLFTHSRSLFFAAKNIFSKGLAGIYFKSANPFGKPCIGACKTELFEHFSQGGRLNR